MTKNVSCLKKDHAFLECSTHDGELLQGLELVGSDLCATGVGKANPEAGGEALVAGGDEEGRSVDSWADPWHPRLRGRKETWR